MIIQIYYYIIFLHVGLCVIIYAIIHQHVTYNWMAANSYQATEATRGFRGEARAEMWATKNLSSFDMAIVIL